MASSDLIYTIDRVERSFIEVEGWWFDPKNIIKIDPSQLYTRPKEIKSSLFDVEMLEL